MSRIIFAYAGAIRQHFDTWFNRGRHETLDADASLFKALFAVSLICLIIATIGYAISGYHWQFHEINAFSTQLHPSVLHHMTSFGDGIFIMSLLLFVAHKSVPRLYVILVAILIGSLVSQALKRYFNADRPPSVLPIDSYNLIGKAYYSRSFPSGHTLTAFLVASVAASFTHSWTVRVFLLFAAFLAGLSRILLGVHWPIDTLVGAGLGSFIGMLSIYISRQRILQASRTFIIFSLVVLSLACISALISPNDYAYAQALIYIVSTIALWKTCKYFFSPNTLLDKNSNTSPFFERISSQLKTYTFHFSLLLFALTLYRIGVLSQDHLQLFYDEAYYFHWSLMPDLGYYSKPPMVAWCIAFTTALFGDSSFAIKLAAPTLYSLSAYIIFLTGRLIGTSNQGAIAGIIFLAAPVVGFNSAFITTDAPMIFLWSATLYTFFLAIKNNSWRYWLALGLCAGFGMLSKYTMAILPTSLFLFLLSSPRHRMLLANTKPWLAALLAGVIFSLNLYWNSQNQWIAFQHTQEIAKQKEHVINLLGLAEFWLAQLFVLGPIWCWMLFRIWRVRSNTSKSHSSSLDNTDINKALAFSSVGILLVISVQAITSHAFANWAAPWIIGVSLLLARTLPTNQWTSTWLRRGLLVQLLLVSAFYHWPQILDTLHIEQKRKNNPYQRLAGWEKVSEQIIPQFSRFPEARLASNSRDLLAYIGYHAQKGKVNFARWNPNENNIRDHYDLKMNLRLDKNQEQTYIFVSKTPLSPATLAQFSRSTFLDKIESRVFSDMTRTVYVYKLENFTAYDSQ